MKINKAVSERLRPIRPGHLKIDIQTPASLQFQLGTLTRTITSEHVGTCEGQTPSVEATGRGVCPSSCVGQTGRQFGTRMKEHKSAVKGKKLRILFSP